MRPDRLKVLMSGMVAGVPGHGGASWAVLQWVLGLRSLGHDVMLVEPVDELSPDRLTYFEAMVSAFGLEGRAALVTPARSTAGATPTEVGEFAASCDLLINTSGVLRDPELLEPVPVRAYLDLDPAFTQVWHEVYGIDLGLEAHTHFVTVGLNVGRPGCCVPTGGRDWITTLPPVDVDRWKPPRAVSTEAWTTVANWRGYGNADHGGVRYGQKAHSWRSLLDLPALTGVRLAPALAIHPHERTDLASLHGNGWQLLDPGVVAGDPSSYHEFVCGSRGELGVAKEGYVVSGSGWFSDRSACYLAAGRPVVAQDTGWSRHLPVGEGLFCFRDSHEAAAAIDAAMTGYRRASAGARAVAAELFDARRVLPPILEELA